MREQIIDDPAAICTLRVSGKGLAVLLMLTPERIRQLSAAGVFDIEPDGKTNLQVALHAYCEFKRLTHR